MAGESTPTSPSGSLDQAVRLARGNGRAAGVLEAVYRQLQQAIEDRKPVCSASGRCCRFEEFGHRLYVTPLELGVFLDRLEQEAGGPGHPPAGAKSGQVISLSVLKNRPDGGGCRFQEGGLCTVHAIRPFGCRIFFCDPSAELWQQEQYERFHQQIKLAHAELGIPYLYVEWRLALASLLPG